MSIDSPKGDPGHQSGQEYLAGVEAIKQAAGATVANTKSIAGQIDAEAKIEAGAEEEARREIGADDPNAKPTGEAEIGFALVENAVLPTAAKVASTILETVSDKRTNASNFTGAEAKGLGASSKARSIDTDFTTMRRSSSTVATGSGIESATRGKSLLERMGITEKSLGEQEGTTVGKAATQTNIAQLEMAKMEVQSLGLRNAQVYDQAMAMQAKHAHLAAPNGPGGVSAPALKGDRRMTQGPAFRMNLEGEGDQSDSLMG